MQDEIDCFGKGSRDQVRGCAKRFVISPIDEDWATAGVPGTINIPPAIADEVTFCQVNLEACGGTQEHPGSRLPAVTGSPMAAPGVVTNLNRIQHWQCFLQA